MVLHCLCFCILYIFWFNCRYLKYPENTRLILDEQIEEEENTHNEQQEDEEEQSNVDRNDGQNGIDQNRDRLNVTNDDEENQIPTGYDVDAMELDIKSIKYDIDDIKYTQSKMAKEIRNISTSLHSLTKLVRTITSKFNKK